MSNLFYSERVAPQPEAPACVEQSRCLPSVPEEQSCAKH